jgi:predicted N-acetyltransferase YhbS
VSGFDAVPFPKIEGVTYRVLGSDEAGKLMPLLKEQGWGLPYPHQASAVVAEYEGKIVAFAVLQILPNVGPLWVAPEWRATGLAEGVTRELVKYMLANGTGACIAVATNPFSEHLCRVLGMKEISGKLFARE